MHYEPDPLADFEKGIAIRLGDRPRREAARQQIDLVKNQLGERGPVWWSDGAPDLNRHLAKNTPYAQWLAELDVEQHDS